MAALLDRSLNVLAAAQPNTALGEELLSFAGMPLCQNSVAAPCGPGEPETA